MSDEAIRIECPGCHARFRLRKRPSNPSAKVKCPKCGTKIPIFAPDGSSRSATSPTEREPRKDDEQLRKMLLQAKRRRSSAGADNNHPEHERTPAPEIDDTQPDLTAKTMPMGQRAFTARDLGTDGAATPPRPPTKRQRLDTPRAGAQMAPKSIMTDARRSSPQPGKPPLAPVVDEPTYTGPIPGRTPKITPTDHDLARFLQPGNYMVRVEDVVYAPVTEKTLAKLVDSGTIVAVDEIASVDGQWFEIAAGDLLMELKARLAHRAHHMLARVVPGRPASEFGRPPPALDPTATPDSVAEGADPAARTLRRDDAAVESPVLDDRETHDGTAQSTDADREPANRAEPKKKRRGLLAVVLVICGLLAVGTVAGIALLRPGTVDDLSAMVNEDEHLADEIVFEPPAPNDSGFEPIDPRPAFQSAVAAVDSAHAVADSIDGLLHGAVALGDEEATTTLSWMKWLRAPTDVDSQDLMERLLARSHWKEARQIANWLIATKGESDELREVVNTTLRKQFDEETVLTVTLKEFRRIARIDPGHRPAIILERNDGTHWTMMPDLGDDHWRGDIAVYRLCQLMVCHFAIPQTRAMEMDKKTWQALARKSDDGVKEMANRLRSDFDWSKNGVVKGSIRRFPGGAPWPIEATGIWRPWLKAGTGTQILAQDVQEAHHAIAFFGADKVYAELSSVTARQLARQISTILLVDYLVGNWNRFAPTQDNWGSRTYIDDGLIASAEDSAAFLGDDSVRVNGRFSWTTRFSRAVIDSLESLDPEVVDPLLFPDATKVESEKLDRMWSQRRRALRRINKLVKQYGADDVYALDAPRKTSNKDKR